MRDVTVEIHCGMVAVGGNHYRNIYNPDARSFRKVE